MQFAIAYVRFYFFAGIVLVKIGESLKTYPVPPEKFLLYFKRKLMEKTIFCNVEPEREHTDAADISLIMAPA